VLIAGYFATLVSCIVVESQLTVNSNRAGFMSVAQLPVIFLFSAKNSIMSFLCPGHGYEKLNFIHRWAGRGLFLSAVTHGSLWITQHRKFDIPILGEQKETSGVAAFGVLCTIVLTSILPVRRWFYQGFFIVHTLGYAAFFITVCVHTPYAEPWIFPCLAFYGLDLLFRMLRSRMKDAVLVPVGNQMTLINIHDCDLGWHAGQHVRLRVFFEGRLFESHPLTILNAPSPVSNISCRTLTLGSRAVGDWSRALHAYAQREKDLILKAMETEKPRDDQTVGVPAQVMIDGPYGGCSINLGEYESVLLFSGGSGVTFSLGMLDDIVGRVVRLGREGGERTKRIEFAWCIRSYGYIHWVAPMLMDIATIVAGCPSLDLHISIFVTCLCDPEAVPPIQNSVVRMERPTTRQLLNDIITPPADDVADGLKWVGMGGGLGVCASGPIELTRDVANAVAKLSLSGNAKEVGGVGLHTETFAL